MAVAIKKTGAANPDVAPHWHAKAREIQKFGTVIEDLPHALDAKVRADMVAQLNQLLADSITLRDMYKKHHWQVTGPTFYQLHLLFDKHFDEQVEIVDTIAERVQLLGGVTVAMGGDAAEMTRIARPPRGREEGPGPDLAHAGGSQAHHQELPGDLRGCRQGWGSGNERSCGQRCSPSQ